jgi:hypothetical protein
MIQYSRACGSYQDFNDRGLLLARKLLNQGFLSVQLKSWLRKIYGHHHDLVDRYGISVSHMTMDMFHLSSILPDPFLVHDLYCNYSMPIYPLQSVFYPQNRPCIPKIVGTFYMQGYKVKDKTAIVPHCTPSFKTQWAPWTRLTWWVPPEFIPSI